ncbi:MAG: OmcA/MtrC family decaheme c-type cytochrome [Acidobacteria bacterium]|nr:OmcA/MtrC family decaheme c-type cytochrome [Acidobacteriota bacterium]
MGKRFAVCFLFVLAAEKKGPYLPSQKAFYADERTINFVRPGLTARITAAVIAADGTISADVRLTDPRGLPLDREGITTPGSVALSFVATVLPANAGHYTSYTTRIRTAAGTGRQAVQAAADAGGRFTKLDEGLYRYTFQTKAPANADRTATHSIGVYGNRNLAEFDLGIHYSSNVFNFVPAGGAVVRKHDIIRTETCNSCHEDLNFHGGSRRGMEMCVLCHQPQSTDPVTGNTLDMGVMSHKIHSGSALPSVKAGGKYQLNGFGGIVDYSAIKFSASGGTSNCAVCHKDAVSTAHLSNPTRAACGSCHDDINFATGTGHRDLPQANDNNCSRCHIPQGDGDYDASVSGAHVVPNFSSFLKGVKLGIVRVDDAVAGKQPVVTFSIRNNADQPVALSTMDRLNVYLSGPATDHLGAVSGDARRAETVNDGTYRFLFPSAIPADAKGTYRISLTGRQRLQLNPGTAKQRQADDIATSVETFFAVDNSRAVARRRIVDTAKCNSCHVRLTFHGTQNTVEQCAMCHNADLVDADSKQSGQFTAMIHRIHSGKELGEPYVLGGADWSHVAYPGVRSNCVGCHINNSQQLPLPRGLRDVREPAGPLELRKPEANACLSCHSSIAAAAHAQVNTAPIGESCSVCHGRNSEFSVDRVHAR